MSRESTTVAIVSYSQPALLLWLSICFSCTSAVSGQVTQSTYKVPEGLVRGAAFIDMFRKAPLQGELRTDVWGADGVIPRDVANGIEAPDYSYWGGNSILGDDGKYHMFVARWPENNVVGKRSGHRTWSQSIVAHVVSEDPMGPYTFVSEIGPLHNPEVYRRKDGSFIIGGWKGKAYKADTLDGPWEQIEPSFEWLNGPVNTGNRTHVVRADGSVLMMAKKGQIFISDHADEHYRQVTDSVYPAIPKAKFEDPVIWKDEVQYHAVFNDWYGRVAFHSRSADGIKWKQAPGHAYDTNVMQHEGGTAEKWFKYERPKVVQDSYGRATHMNFAVIDVSKKDDIAGDNHNSKNIFIPLTVPRRLRLLGDKPLTAQTEKIELKILGEPGFDPLQDIDLKSLRFGAAEAVDFGRGCKAITSRASGKDLIVVFGGKGNEIAEHNFAAKLLGSEKSGDLLIGYVNLP